MFDPFIAPKPVLWLQLASLALLSAGLLALSTFDVLGRRRPMMVAMEVVAWSAIFFSTTSLWTRQWQVGAAGLVMFSLILLFRVGGLLLRRRARGRAPSN